MQQKKTVASPTTSMIFDREATKTKNPTLNYNQLVTDQKENPKIL